MRDYNCLCEKCKFTNECKYYEETVKPIIESADSLLCYPDDDFEIGIYNLLDNFECDNFEEKEEMYND